MQSILAIETSTDACSVAISTHTGIFSQLVVEPQAHAKLLLDMVNAVLVEADMQLSDMTALAFGMGPGSFTGVRIAASVIQGLAVGVQKRVIGISSLRALAQQAIKQNPDTDVVAIIDARMQEIYYGVYKANAFGVAQTIIADGLQKPYELILDPKIKYLAVGTGVKTYANILQTNNPNLIINLSIQYPRAEEVAQLALAELATDNTLLPEEAIPTYIRDDVAQKSKKNPD